MISVTEARKIIEKNVSSLQPVKLALASAAGKILAEDVYAAVDIPAFDQSSMDGYAFSFSDLKDNKRLKIKGEMAAGSNATFSVLPGIAARIFTGAAVPSGTDTVVMQEKTKIENDQIVIDDENLQQGLNVRIKGSEIKAGALALEKNSVLSPAAIGFLAGIGVTEVKVYPNPSDQEFTIELPSPAQQSMKLTMANQLGQFTEVGALGEGEQSKKISTQGLAEGVYILQLGSNGNALRTKVVVLHK